MYNEVHTGETIPIVQMCMEYELLCLYNIKETFKVHVLVYRIKLHRYF